MQEFPTNSHSDLVQKLGRIFGRAPTLLAKEAYRATRNAPQSLRPPDWYRIREPLEYLPSPIADFCGRRRPLLPIRDAKSLSIVNFTGERANWGCQATSWELSKFILETVQWSSRPEVRFIPLLPIHEKDREIAHGFGGQIRQIMSSSNPTAAEKSLLERLAQERYEKFADMVKTSDLVVFQAEGTMTGTDFIRGERLLLLPWVAKMCWNKPVLAINQTLFSAESAFETVIQQVFSKFDLVAVRELWSLSFAKRLGLTQAVYIPDLAFRTKPLAIAPLRLDASRRYLAVAGSASLDAYPLESYVDLVSAASEIADLDPLVLASTGLDLQLAEALRKRLGRRVVELAPSAPYTAVVSALERSMLLLGGRFHMGVLATCAGCPSVLLPANTPKNEGLAAMVPGTHLLAPDNRAEALQAIAELVENNAAARSGVHAAHAKICRDIATAHDWLSSVLSAFDTTSRTLQRRLHARCAPKPLSSPPDQRWSANLEVFYRESCRQRAQAFSYLSGEGATERFGQPIDWAPHIVRLVVSIRREIDAALNFSLLRQIVEDNTDAVARQLSTRWLVSTLDSFADYGTGLEQRNALLATEIANLEKVYETYVLWRFGDCRPFKGQNSPLEPADLWDGMRTFDLDIGDVTNNLFRRFFRLLEATPAICRMAAEVINRLSSNDTILAALNERHGHLFTPHSAWVLQQKYRGFHDRIPDAKLLDAELQGQQLHRRETAAQDSQESS